MPDVLGSAEILVKANTSGFSTELKEGTTPAFDSFKLQAEEAGAEAGKEMGKAADKESGESAGGFSSLKEAAKGAAELIGIGSIVELGKQSIEAASADQQATAQLGVAFKSAGLNLANYKTQVDASTKSMQTLGFTGPQTSSALTVLMRATGNVSTSTKDLSLAANVAAARHISLAQAALLVGKVQDGNFQGLGRLGIATKDQITQLTAQYKATGDVSGAMDLLGQKFGGAAQAQTKTFAGAMQALQATLEGALATIGSKLLPILDTLIPVLTPIVNILGGALANAVTALSPILTILGQMLSQVATVLGGILTSAIQAIEPIFQALLEAIQPIIPVMQSVVDQVISDLQPAFNQLLPAIQSLSKPLTDLVGSLGSILEAVLPLLPVLVTLLEAVIPIVPAIGDLTDALLKGLNPIIKAASDLIKTLVTDALTPLANFIKDTLTTTIKDFGPVFKTVWDAISTAITDIKTTFENTWNDITTFFTGIPGKISKAADGMWDGISGAFKTVINTIIGWWDDLHFHIPGFHLGPVHFGGFDLGLPQIPKLQQGGIVMPTPGGTLALIAEGGFPEAIVPLPSGTPAPLPTGTLGGGATQVFNVMPGAFQITPAPGNDAASLAATAAMIDAAFDRLTNELRAGQAPLSPAA